MLRRAVGSTYIVAHRFNGGLQINVFLEFRRNDALKMYAPFPDMSGQALRNSETNFDNKPTVKTVGYKTSRAYGSA